MKKGLLIGIVVLLLCCCISVFGFFALFGHFELNGKCAYKGPNATVTSGACATQTSNQNNNVNPQPQKPTTPQSSIVEYDGDSSSIFTFKYDSELLTLNDNPSNPQILIMLTTDGSTGFADNVNFVQTASSFLISEANCQSYGETVINQLQGQLTVIDTSFSTRVVTINGQTACHAYWQAESGETEIEQNQFVFTNSGRNKAYIITVTSEIDSLNSDTLLDVVDTFELK